MQFDENTIVRVSGLLDSGYTKPEIWRKVDTHRHYSNPNQFFASYAHQKNQLEKMIGLVKSRVKTLSEKDYLEMKQYIDEEGGSWEGLAKKKGRKDVPQFKYWTIKRAKEYGVNFTAKRDKHGRTWTKAEITEVIEARKTHTWPELYATCKKNDMTPCSSLDSFMVTMSRLAKKNGLSFRIAGRKSVTKKPKQSAEHQKRLDWLRENWELSNAVKRRRLAAEYFEKFGQYHRVTDALTVIGAVDASFRRHNLGKGESNEYESSAVMAD